MLVCRPLSAIPALSRGAFKAVFAASKTKAPATIAATIKIAQSNILANCLLASARAAISGLLAGVGLSRRWLRRSIPAFSAGKVASERSAAMSIRSCVRIPKRMPWDHTILPMMHELRCRISTYSPLAIETAHLAIRPREETLQMVTSHQSLLARIRARRITFRRGSRCLGAAMGT